MKTKLILLGGFLGAGKTTTLSEAAKILADQGKKVGIITNDQASELVDTAFLTLKGAETKEVSGSCFCCNFPGFAGAINALLEKGADVILAEPVGSCTDLSATIMQPLKENFSDKVSIAPLSVLADALRLKDILSGGNSGLHESAAYIVRKQLEEGDFIVINKTDLLSTNELKELVEKTKQAFPKATVYTISAQASLNVAAWLERAQAAESAGTHILSDINYDTYAEGEAVLGWLNATIECSGKNINWKKYTMALMAELASCFDGNDQAVGHVKSMIAYGDKLVIANITGNSNTLKLRGDDFSSDKAVLTLNARVETSPETLEAEVRDKIASVMSDAVSTEIKVIKCLKPGRPNPTYRYDHVV